MSAPVPHAHVIEKIHNHDGSHQPKRASSAQHSGGANFAALHAHALKSGHAKPGSTTPNGAGKLLPGVNTTLRPPRGETWAPVPGRAGYADIIEGDRNGFYVNLRPGKRQGEAFVIAHRHGKTYHVYGEGKHKEWVPVREPRKPPPGVEWEKVGAHHDYRRVEGGKDDGKYINLSGNERDGRHFEIVKRGGRTFHVYGTGKDKLEIEVGWRSRRAERD